VDGVEVELREKTQAGGVRSRKTTGVTEPYRLPWGKKKNGGRGGGGARGKVEVYGREGGKYFGPRLHFSKRGGPARYQVPEGTEKKVRKTGPPWCLEGTNIKKKLERKGKTRKNSIRPGPATEKRT